MSDCSLCRSSTGGFSAATQNTGGELRNTGDEPRTNGGESSIMPWLWLFGFAAAGGALAYLLARGGSD